MAKTLIEKLQFYAITADHDGELFLSSDLKAAIARIEELETKLNDKPSPSLEHAARLAECAKVILDQQEKLKTAKYYSDIYAQGVVDIGAAFGLKVSWMDKQNPATTVINELTRALERAGSQPTDF